MATRVISITEPLEKALLATMFVLVLYGLMSLAVKSPVAVLGTVAVALMLFGGIYGGLKWFEASGQNSGGEGNE